MIYKMPQGGRRRVKELKTDIEFRNAFFIMKQLRPYLEEEHFLEAIERMRQNDGYQLFAWIDDDGQYVMIAGLKFQENLYDRYHLWLDDLVTDETKRSQGNGKKALVDIERFAKRQGASKVVLSSGLSRKQAHSFYENKMNYGKKSYVYFKKL
ncbi:GNAT family N-acetyltransferase [Salibacterium salarium]|uniref:GNAT family N-acetyltransferase n=1 Tax=Salibacterium salarium TaxID=284579 RepID=A0A3R9QUG8_9BACI|nr:GNAT family N-acetyltransferase [Salibacterium salarium]